MAAFAVQDWVEWSSGTCEPRKAVVVAIDEMTTPKTYIVKFEDGSKKGAREAQLKKTEPPQGAGEWWGGKGEAMIGNLAGKMKGFLGTVSTAGAKTVSGLKEKMANVKARGEDPNPPRSETTETPQKETERPKDGKLEELVRRGFAENTAQSALLLADGDVETALRYLEGEGEAGECGESSERSEYTEDGYSQNIEATPPVEPAAAPDPFLDFVPSQQPTPPDQPLPSTDDAFDFLSAAPAPSLSVDPPAVPRCITVSSTMPGRVGLAIQCCDLPPGPVAASHVSISVKPVGAPRWQHQIDTRTGGIIPFTHHAEWKETCHTFSSGVLNVTATLSTAFPSETDFEICARVATPMGPGPASSVITVTVPIEVVHVDVNDLDDFFSTSPGPSGASSPARSAASQAARKTYYPPHAKGALYDVD